MAELSTDVVDEAERLTRLARRADTSAEAQAYRERRDALLAEHGYAARVRSASDGDTLVCYPEDWLVEGTVDTDRIDDIDRAHERSLSGPGDPDEWAAVEATNQSVVERVREQHGPDHAANAAALAAFASDHYAKPIASLTEPELEEFRTEYYVRNVWPTDDQAAILDASIAYARQAAETERS